MVTLYHHWLKRLVATTSQDSHHPAHAQSHPDICFPFYCIQRICLPTAKTLIWPRMRRLIRTIAIHILPKTSFRMARIICRQTPHIHIFYVKSRRREYLKATYLFNQTCSFNLKFEVNMQPPRKGTHIEHSIFNTLESRRKQTA